MTEFSFIPIQPRRWTGRYARIPGEVTAFHVQYLNSRWMPSVRWSIGDDVALCPMVGVDSAGDLASAVNAGKRLLGGTAGGAFLVNEYGQVLVPSPSGNGTVALVGECEGRLTFKDSFATGQFDLSDDHGLTVGDAWDLPYLGIPHNLSRTSELYFWDVRRTSGWKVTPPVQDYFLIDALRTLRPQGPVRFVVGVGGIVLTKVPTGNWRDPRWESRFVGRIDYERWYSKEV